MRIVDHHRPHQHSALSHHTPSTMKAFFAIFLLGISISVVRALDNGLALTPPMGWMSWQRFRCQVDCKNYPRDCISEDLIRRTADALESHGWREAGYRYVIIDDCWPMKYRDRQTSLLVPDTDRFPNGPFNLGEYLHSKNLLFGIYLDYGTFTCERYPGSVDYLELDANTVTGWGADYIKMDGCYSSIDKMPGGYEEFSKFLNRTGRPVVFSCSYPAYISWTTNYTAIDWDRLSRNCNLWRMLPDIDDRWTSITSIINAYRDHSKLLASIAGPGHWNDPDMLVLGNFGLSRDQERVQMGMWCMFAAPLLISADMDEMNEDSENILKNPELIAIDQDAGGHQAEYIETRSEVQLWIRRLTKTEHSWAIALVNMRSGGGPIHLPITMKEMLITSQQPETDLFQLTDVFTRQEFGLVGHTEPVVIHVNPTGIAMYRVELKVT